jgi:hypothetical protein
LNLQLDILATGHVIRMAKQLALLTRNRIADCEIQIAEPKRHIAEYDIEKLKLDLQIAEHDIEKLELDLQAAHRVQDILERLILLRSDPACGFRQ